MVNIKQTDVEHLYWLHNRIVNTYGENENVDFLVKFREIIGSLTTQKENLKYEYSDGFHYFTNDDGKQVLYPGYYDVEIARKEALNEFKKDEEL